MKDRLPNLSCGYGSAHLECRDRLVDFVVEQAIRRRSGVKEPIAFGTPRYRVSGTVRDDRGGVQHVWTVQSSSKVAEQMVASSLVRDRGAGPLSTDQLQCQGIDLKCQSSAEEDVLVVAAVQGVRTGSADQDIPPGPTFQHIISKSADQYRGSNGRFDIDRIVVGSSVHDQSWLHCPDCCHRVDPLSSKERDSRGEPGAKVLTVQGDCDLCAGRVRGPHGHRVVPGGTRHVDDPTLD